MADQSLARPRLADRPVLQRKTSGGPFSWMTAALFLMVSPASTFGLTPQSRPSLPFSVATRGRAFETAPPIAAVAKHDGSADLHSAAAWEIVMILKSVMEAAGITADGDSVDANRRNVRDGLANLKENEALLGKIQRTDEGEAIKPYLNVHAQAGEWGPSCTTRRSNRIWAGVRRTLRLTPAPFSPTPLVRGMIGASIGVLSPLLVVPITVKGLIVCVIGGLGSIPGAIIAGLAVGAFENFFLAFRGVTERDMYVMLLLFVFLVFRPGGIFSRSVARD